MLRIVSLSTFLIALIFCTSCDCYFQVSGVVMDRSTGQPLQHVVISRTTVDPLDSADTTDVRSNEDGSYRISAVSGNCRKIRLYYTKAQYTTVQQSNKAGIPDTIWMETAPVPAIDPAQLVGKWELYKSVKATGYTREKRGEYVQFFADGTCATGKIDGEVRRTGTWTLVTETAEVIVSIQETEKEDGAYILKLTTDELVVLDRTGTVYLKRVE